MAHFLRSGYPEAENAQCVDCSFWHSCSQFRFWHLAPNQHPLAGAGGTATVLVMGIPHIDPPTDILMAIVLPMLMPAGAGVVGGGVVGGVGGSGEHVVG